MKKILTFIGVMSFCLCIFSQSTDVKHHALKFDFFSPVRGCFALSFETPLSDDNALDIEAGYIGIKPHSLNVFKNYSNYQGGYLSAGIRFYLKKDESFSDFKGFYFKPEILANYFSYQREELIYTQKVDDYFFTLLTGTDASLNVLMFSGYQWLLSDFVLFDIWYGIGYGANWINESKDSVLGISFDYDSNQYNKFSHRQVGPSKILIDCGLSIGILLK